MLLVGCTGANDGNVKHRICSMACSSKHGPAPVCEITMYLPLLG